MGRPSTYTPEIADKICERISSTLLGTTQVAEEFGITRETLFKWRFRHPEFADKYARAKENQQELAAEEILEIADDSSRDTKTIKRGKEEFEVENSEWINRSRLRVETRKWLMSKLAPKKYGDKLAMEHSGAVTLVNDIPRPNRD